MEDVIHSSGWEKIVFLSTIDEPRNKSKISKIWNVTISGGPLYKKSTNRGLEYYQEKGLLEKEGDDFKAVLDSEAFQEELIECLENSDEINQYFIDNIDKLIDFFSNDKVVNNILKPQMVKTVFGEDKDSRLENVREDALARYFVLIVNAGVKLWIDKESDSFLENFGGDTTLMTGMVKGMFEALFQDVSSNSKYDIDPLIGEMDSLYEENEDIMEFMIRSYNQIVRSEIEKAMPESN